MGFSSPRSSCRVSEIINNAFIYEPVNDDTFFDYDNLDVNEYDLFEEEIPKTIGSQQCHMFKTC